MEQEQDQAQGQDDPVACEQCGSANISRDFVSSAFWHDDRLVVVEDIPALVCGNCREQFYHEGTMMLLDLLRGENFPPEKARGELRVPVFSLRDRAGAKGRETP